MPHTKSWQWWQMLLSSLKPWQDGLQTKVMRRQKGWWAKENFQLLQFSFCTMRVPQCNLQSMSHLPSMIHKTRHRHWRYPWPPRLSLPKRPTLWGVQWMPQDMTLGVMRETKVPQTAQRKANTPNGKKDKRQKKGLALDTPCTRVSVPFGRSEGQKFSQSQELDTDLEGCTVPDRRWEGEAILDGRANMSKRQDSRFQQRAFSKQQTSYVMEGCAGRMDHTVFKCWDAVSLHWMCSTTRI